MKRARSRLLHSLLAMFVPAAVAYFLAARLGFLTVASHTGIPLFWPAAGVALAAAVVGGWSGILGCALGAFIAFVPTMGTSVAAIQVLNGIVQAWLGAFLMKRLIKPLPPVHRVPVLMTIGLAAVIAAVRPLLGELVRGIAEGAPPPDAFLSSVNWWITTLISLLAVAPALIAVGLHQRRKLVEAPLTWVTSSFLIGLGLFAFLLARNDEAGRLSVRLNADAHEMAAVIEGTLRESEDSLFSVRDFFRASQNVERAEFAQFVQPIMARSLFIQALVWAPRLPESGRRAYEAGIRAEGFRDFRITERDADNRRFPAAARPEYFPLTYVEPLAVYRSVIGYDLGSDSDRLPMLREAWDTGEPTLKEGIRLVQQVPGRDHAMLMIPVYRSGARVDTVQTRRAGLFGFVYMIFQPQIVVDLALGEINAHDIEVTLSLEAEGKLRRMAFHASESGRSPDSQALPAEGPGLRAALFQRRFTLFGREWLIEARPGAAYVRAVHGLGAWARLALGLIGALVFLLYADLRRRSEAKLKASEAQYRLISDNSADLIWVLDPETRGFLFLSPATEKLLGYPVPEARARKLDDLVTPESAVRIQEALAANPPGPKASSLSLEVEMVRKDGSTVPCEVTASYAAAEDGRLQIVGATRDISERREAEKEIHQLASLVRNTSEMVALAGLDGRIQFLNKAGCDLLGVDASEMGKIEILDVIPDDWKETVVRDVLPAQTSEGQWEGDLAYRNRKTGRVIPVHALLFLIRDEAAGTPLFLANVSLDITERKRAENDLRESRARLEEAQSIARLGSFERDLKTGEATWSRELFRLLDRDPGRGAPSWEEMQANIAEADRQAYLDALERTLRTGQDAQLEIGLVGAEGRLRYAEVSLSKHKENPDRIIGTLMDVTARREAEQAVRRVEERNRALIENAPDGICLIDAEGKFVFGSPSAFRMFGFEPEEMIGRPALARMHPEDAARIHERYVALVSRPGDEATLEYRYQDKAGRYHWVEGHFKNLLGDPSVGAVVNNFRDVTEAKAASEDLRRSEARLEAAQAIAHMGSWELDPRTGIGTWSKEMFRLFRRDPSLGVPIFKDYFDYVAEEDHAPLMAAQERAIETGELQRVEYRLRSREEGVRTLAATIYAVKDGRGDLLHMAGTVQDITQRKQAEEAIRLIEMRNSALIENAPDGIVLLDDQGRFVFASPSAYRMFGFAREDVMGQTALQYMHPADLPMVQDAFAGFNADPSAVLNLEYRFRNKAGEYRWIEGHFRNMIGVAGVDGVILNFRDITEAKLAAESLKASERRGQTLLKAIPDLMLRITRDGVIRDYWANQERSLALPSERFLGRSVLEVMPPDVGTAWRDASEKAFRSGSLQTFEYDLAMPGQTGRFEGRLSPNLEEGEAVLIVRDITESRDATARIRQLSRVVEQMDDMVIITDVDGKIFYVNPAFERQTGFAAADALGRTPRILKSGLESPGFYKALWETITAGETFQGEIRNRKKNGEIYVESRTITPVRGEDGRIVHYVATGRDVTQRKQMEHDLRERLKELTCLSQVQKLLERNPEPEELGPQVVRFLEPAMQYSDVAVAVVEFDGFVSARDATAIPLRTLEAPILIGGQTRGRVAVGYTVDLPFIIPEEQALVDNIAHMLGLWFDLRHALDSLARERNSLARRVDERTADLQKANIELARAAKLKDEFLSSMSHELRTPLNGILGLTESLEEGVYGPLGSQQLPPLRTVGEAGRHLLALINDILDLSKIEAGRLEIHPAAIPVEAVCQASLRMIKQPAHQKSLGVDLHLEGVGQVLADERRLKQMLVNLLGNAVKFTPDGGKIGLDVRPNEATGSVRFTVWDTGIGIAPDKMKLLFQPFTQIDSSLSRQYSGTGLGLSLVRQLAELHGGSAGVESEPGRGSRFFFDLPAASAPPVDEAEPGEAGPVAVKVALVVDDSVTTGDQLMRYLKEMGAQVTVELGGTRSVERAVAIRPDVILLDLIMPDRSGWDVLADLKSDPRTRTIPVVLCSVLEERERGLAAGAQEYLVKPVGRDALRAALQRALRSSGAMPSAVETPAPLPPAPAVAAATPLILVAEDNRINQQLLHDFLVAKGFLVALAVNGAEAVAQAEALNPALVLMDIQMPIMDGLEAIRRLRSQPRFQGLPIVALTALAMPGDREKCLEAGANEFMTKPIGLKALAELIGGLLTPKSDANPS